MIINPTPGQKIYSALVSQSGVNNPSVDQVLWNTLGTTVTFTRNGVGLYRIVLGSPILPAVAQNVLFLAEADGAYFITNVGVINATTYSFATFNLGGVAADALLGSGLGGESQLTLWILS